MADQNKLNRLIASADEHNGCRYWNEYRDQHPQEKIDLSGADLSGKTLCGANLSGANLSGANLSGTSLCGTNLYKADLYKADLTGTVGLGAIKWAGVKINRANLQKILSAIQDVLVVD